MNNRDFNRIAAIYRNSSELVVDSREVMNRLLSGLIAYIKQAQNAYEQKRYDTMFEYNKRSLKVIAGIRQALERKLPDSDDLSPLITELLALYQSIYIRLTNVLKSKAPHTEFDHFIETLQTQRSLWVSSAA